MSRTSIASTTACLVDPPVAVDLGVVADPASSRFTIRGVPRPRLAISRAASGVHLDAEDPGRPPDDRREVVLAVEVEPVRHRRSGRGAGR